MALEPQYSNPEFNQAVDQLFNVVKNELAKKGNKSPTRSEVVKICKQLLENRQ